MEERGREVEEPEEVGGRENMPGSQVTRGGGNAAMCELELQGVLQLALREIRTCQDMSAGPTFMVGCNINWSFKYKNENADTAWTKVWPQATTCKYP